MPDGLAIETAHDHIWVGVLAAIEINDAQAIHEAAHHEDRGGPLDHGDGPYACHDHRQTGGPALTDIVTIDLAFRRGFPRRVVMHLRRRSELESCGGRKPEPVILASTMLPGSCEVERRLGTSFGNIRRRQCT